MGLTIYIRLSEEESELVRSVAGHKHNRWARQALLKEAAGAIPIAEIKDALERAGISPERQEWILARFA